MEWTDRRLINKILEEIDKEKREDDEEEYLGEDEEGDWVYYDDIEQMVFVPRNEITQTKRDEMRKMEERKIIEEREMNNKTSYKIERFNDNTRYVKNDSDFIQAPIEIENLSSNQQIFDDENPIIIKIETPKIAIKTLKIYTDRYEITHHPNYSLKPIVQIAKLKHKITRNLIIKIPYQTIILDRDTSLLAKLIINDELHQQINFKHY